MGRIDVMSGENGYIHVCAKEAREKTGEKKRNKDLWVFLNNIYKKKNKEGNRKKERNEGKERKMRKTKTKNIIFNSLKPYELVVFIPHERYLLII